MWGGCVRVRGGGVRGGEARDEASRRRGPGRGNQSQATERLDEDAVKQMHALFQTGVNVADGHTDRDFL